MADLTPFALRDAPALIESVFPAQKVSYEAQTERKAGASQTLTGLGSYWKGRKPLILVRAIILGSLLPQTEDSEQDLTIFEKLMAFDNHGLARRAFAHNQIKPKDIAAHVNLSNPWVYFTAGKNDDLLQNLQCPFDATKEGISLRWLSDVPDKTKLQLIEQAMAAMFIYEKKAGFCRRPEEVDQDWLYEPVWPEVNKYYAQWGINAHSFPELVEQFGILRFDHRPKVGDSFCGGGSIPFEAARLGCDVYASDLNPIATMLTWGALNVVGAPIARHTEFEDAEKAVIEKVDNELINLGIEHDDQGNRAKAYLYCLETQCPETGWMIPMLPSRVISHKQKIIARFTPDYERKCFHIEIAGGVSDAEFKKAEKGTVVDGALDYEIDGIRYRTPVKTLRGDISKGQFSNQELHNHYEQSGGKVINKLRRWEKHDFISRTGDIFQERLYVIQWINKASIHQSRQETYFRSVTESDLIREHKVEEIVAENIENWQAEGLVPDMVIEPGTKTTELIRTRGWTYWHHLFNPRQLLLQVLILNAWRNSPCPHLGWIKVAKMADFNSRSCVWNSHGNKTERMFSNQALNTLYSYATRSWAGYDAKSFRIAKAIFPDVVREVIPVPADQCSGICDYWITDPPYADAVSYHEITEYFIAWLRHNPPKEFRDWTWDSRRTLAIKGSGDEFRYKMVGAYQTMAEQMPDSGMQCVMFTHKDTGVWSDMVGIIWSAGLQVISAWYMATETTSGLKKGDYVQGTVILMLRKRPEGERAGFRQHILPVVRSEVERQVNNMMNLNDSTKDKFGMPVFNDADLQMAGYAAAMKVLTAYTRIDGEDATSFAVRPRDEQTVIDDILQQAEETANNLLVPDGLDRETWSRLEGIERFYLRMMDIETTGACKLDNYHNFARAFRVAGYSRIMASSKPNSARLKRITEFASRDLTDGTELGPTSLGRLIDSLQQIVAEVDSPVVVRQLQHDLPDFSEMRPLLIDILSFLEHKAPADRPAAQKSKKVNGLVDQSAVAESAASYTRSGNLAVREAAEILGRLIKNILVLNQ